MTAKQTFWAGANTAFRNKDFKTAIELYEEALSQAEEPLKAYIYFNRDLALRRAKKKSPTSASTSSTMHEMNVFAEKFISINLKGNSDIEFLNSLFNVALGRFPEHHEKKFFLHELEINKIDHMQIARTVFNSEECKRNFNDNPVEFKKRTRIYSIPSLGEIHPHTIKLPVSQTPQVSVIIPVFGKIEYTLACLKSISDYPPNASFEVIVVDDRSPDNPLKFLHCVNNLRVIMNGENLGFLRSCNKGARHAKGEYLLFLNNDTQVTYGWLDELLRTFSIFPGCGLAGSKLIYPDGKLQEAGGIIWQDGSAWNFGNRQNPDLPSFNYAREVDYVSGASIMIPQKLFDSLGGFDLNYIPAYCEDSDLALKIRDRGLRVIYQPRSEVIHFEGISSGTDTTQGVKAYQVSNSQKLYQRWKHLLRTHRPNGQQPDAEKDRRMRNRVLVLEHCTPTPDQDAGSVSVFNIMLLMREMDFQITFIAEDNYLYDPEYTTKLQRAGIEVLYGPYTTSVEKHLQEMGSRYDLVFFFRPKVVERNIEAARRYAPQAKTLFYTHDIHHIRMEREARLLQSGAKQTEADQMKARELAAIRAVDSTIVVSTAEMEILQPQVPDKSLELLPLLLDIPGTGHGFEQRNGIAFVGGYQHTPNVDAVHYFVSEIMPHIRTHLPGVKFHIVGSKPPQSVLDLACADIAVEGYVEELSRFLDTMRVAVAPLRYGAGVKGKVGTALASGLPVVATPIAAEGMEITDGSHVLLANTPDLFAIQITKLYSDKELWQRLSQNGIDFANTKFGPGSSYTALRRIIGRLGFDISAKPRYPLNLYTPAIN